MKKITKKTKEEAEKKEEQVLPPKAEAKPAPKTDGIDAKTEKSALSDIEDMKKNLESQPQVPCFVPLDPGEPEGARIEFCINGHRTSYPKGESISVPQQIYEMIIEKQKVEHKRRTGYMSLNSKSEQDRRALGL